MLQQFSSAAFAFVVPPWSRAKAAKLKAAAGARKRGEEHRKIAPYLLLPSKLVNNNYVRNSQSNQ